MCLLFFRRYLKLTDTHTYTTAIRSLFRHMVCNGPVSCKANRVGNQLGLWRYNDLLAIVYILTYTWTSRSQYAPQHIQSWEHKNYQEEVYYFLAQKCFISANKFCIQSVPLLGRELKSILVTIFNTKHIMQ